jgi:hypothetical protein
MEAMTFLTASTLTVRSVEWSSRRSSCISPFFWVVKKRESEPDPPPALDDEDAMVQAPNSFQVVGG